MTTKTYLQKFLNYCSVERQLSMHTLQAYNFDLIDFQRWLGAGVPLTKVEDSHLKNYLNDMVTHRGLSSATIRRRLACLKSFFRWLCEETSISNPFALWKLKLPKAKRLPRALARTEATSLLRFFDGSSDKGFQTALCLMVATGLRVGELCHISIADLSSDCGILRIHGKGSRDRIAYVTDPMLRNSLRSLVHCRKNTSRNSSLFVNKRGTRLKPQSIRAKLREYVPRGGGANRITPHMLRHTAATLLIENGVDIRFVQRLLGHSTIATTEIYTHVADEALRATLERANVLASLN